MIVYRLITALNFDSYSYNEKIYARSLDWPIQLICLTTEGSWGVGWCILRLKVSNHLSTE